MTDSNQEVPWEVQLATASYNFGIRCRELHESNPYGEALATTLQSIMTHLATELWDQRGGLDFSDKGISGFLTGHDRRNEIHEEAET
jgi:hypothetical protein